MNMLRMMTWNLRRNNGCKEDSYAAVYRLPGDEK